MRKVKRTVTSILLALVLLVCESLSVSAVNVSAYSDVKRGQWYYEAVEYVCDQNLFNGTSATTFSPNAFMTRGMLVTVLGRNSKVLTRLYPGTSYNDVDPGKYYSPYIEWSTEKGIVTGMGSGRFCPEDYLTREQLVTLLYRYALNTQQDVSIRDNSFYTFSDWKKVSQYASMPMRWAVSNGVINGDDGGLLNPGGFPSRAVVAQVLYNAKKYLICAAAPVPVPMPSEEPIPDILPTIRPKPTAAPSVSPTVTPKPTPSPTATPKPTVSPVIKPSGSTTVYVTPTGIRYHISRDCAGRNGTSTTLEKAEQRGFTACHTCCPWV